MNMRGYDFSLGSTIGAMLYIIIKLLIVVLAVIVVLGVIAWVRENLFKNDSLKIVRDIKSDPLLKTVSIITLVIVGIAFFFSLIHNVLSASMNMGMGYQGGYMGYNPTFRIAEVLFLLIRVLMFILVISLVLAGVTYLKDLYESGKLNNIFTTSNKDNTNKVIIDTDNTNNTEIKDNTK